MTDPTPPPGSDAALDDGCECPVLDNCHGKGAFEFAGPNGEPVYWVNWECPLHGTSTLLGVRSIW